MKLSLLSIVALALASIGPVAACGHASSDGNTAVGDDNLTSGIEPGTYVVESRPFGSTYASRITIAAGKKFEAEIVSSSGDTSVLAGSYQILAAQPNNPQSPVLSDKPTLVLESDSGDASIDFELDKLPGGELRLYESARQVSFTVKMDPRWRPQPTNSKVIACTGNTVNATLTLDQAQNRRGTLAITRKSAAGRDDPPSATLPVTQTEGGGVPGYVYFEGSKGEQDYYFNMHEDDLQRGSGSVAANLTWAQGGEEWSVGVSCAFAR